MKKELLFLMLFTATLHGSDTPESCTDKILLRLQKVYTYSSILAVQSIRNPFDVPGNFRRASEVYGKIRWSGMITYDQNPAYFDANGIPHHEDEE